ncbi:uncharacterized protein EDB91DRAFT_1088074 [Suillus paluster]|uniref:uncharacterized protein n=1 Tax=Suillus paluster TaxID=48578 RepID=UPI001B862399|nr:uncharacterized protein EDB91DRAFT_1088074 [Suillus paluster]KAG1722590.1 hypothetical protein EDB91DRAFT_1088074 [Suillus paluster]
MPLQTNLNDLCNDQSLMEDVWITPSMGDVPRWLEDQDIHDGIRAMLKRDRCIEEQWCLGLEADNLCRWVSDKLLAIELALLTPGMQFASRTVDAVSLVQKLSGVSRGCPLQWINTFAVSYVIPTEDEEPKPEVFVETDHTALLLEDTILVDILTARVTGALLVLMACHSTKGLYRMQGSLFQAPSRHKYLLLTTDVLINFAERKPWKLDIKDIMKLIARLLSITQQRNHTIHVNINFDGWVARPLMTEAVQTHSFDCGVWVLAVIAATLHGNHCTSLGEEDMHIFRHYLRTLILQIPVF